MSGDRLEIDFLPRQRLTLTRRGALLAGAAALVWVLALVILQSDRGRAPKTDDDRSTRLAPRPELAASRAELWTPAQRAALEGVVKGLALPWSTLIDRTARAAPPGVSLLAFEPDLTQSVLTLQGEAERASVMVRYLQILERDAHLGQALLRDFEAVPDSSRVRFTIAASMNSVMREGRP
jgi:Tfp pilus assembly protein PilN